MISQSIRVPEEESAAIPVEEIASEFSAILAVDPDPPSRPVSRLYLFSTISSPHPSFENLATPALGIDRLPFYRRA